MRVAEALVRVREDDGRLIHLDIEPEPDGLIENSAELVSFYENWLLPTGAPILARSLNIPLQSARQYILDHIRVCFDACHFAVEYEDYETALGRFTNAGIKIGRIQVSSALKVMLPDDLKRRQRIARDLEPFAESTYLHQVIEQRDDGALYRYPDLVDALLMIHEPGAREWRIHFHVPLFANEYETFGSTQEDIRTVFKLLRKSRCTRYLEIETYTWDVLPPVLKQDLLESIYREYRWVLDEFQV